MQRFIFGQICGLYVIVRKLLTDKGNFIITVSLVLFYNSV